MIDVVYQSASDPLTFFLHDKDKEVVGAIQYRVVSGPAVVVHVSCVDGNAITAEFPIATFQPEGVLEMMHSIGLADGTKEIDDDNE